jgi:DNA gyrase subunit A
VRGIKLKPGEEMISLIIPADNGQILIASENGYGKRTRLDEFSVIGRGGQGMIAMKTGGRNGAVVGAVQVYGDDEMILISDQGILVRTRTEEVSMQGRNTQGVRLINLSEGEHLVGLERVAEPEMGNGTEADDAAPVDT